MREDVSKISIPRIILKPSHRKPVLAFLLRIIEMVNMETAVIIATNSIAININAESPVYCTSVYRPKKNGQDKP